MARIKREEAALFLDTVPSTENYERIGEGVPSAAVNMNPAVTTETYIHESSATIIVDGYAPTLPITQKANVGDDVFDFIESLRIAQATGSDAETTLISCRLYETPTLTAYPATKQNVSIQIDTWGGDGGLVTEVGYTINYIGDPVEGSFDTADNSFTPTP